METIDYLDHGADLAPQAACFVMGERTWTYRDARERTKGIAAGLLRDGLRPGAKAAVVSPNDPEAFLCVLGLLRAHFVWLPINPKYSLDEIVSLLERFECEVLFLHSSFETAVPTLQGRLSRLRLIVSVGKSFDRIPSLDQWMGRPDEWHEPPPATGEDVVAIMATGGTTGKPKGIMQSHRGLETYVANHLATMPSAAPPRYLVAAPMTHAAGLMCLPMLLRGGTTFVIDGAQARAVADAILRWDITDLFLPPTAIYNMLDDPEVAAKRFPSLRYLLYGAAPMAVSRLRAALKLFGPVLVHGFGQMEAIMLCSVLRPEYHFNGEEIASDERLSSCGRPAPFVNLAIMNAEGSLLRAGEVGEIVVRGGNVMLGYYEDPHATAEVSRFGWHHTGDLGYRDVEGFYHIVDRAKDMIISGGYNIFPSQIEQLIWSHPAVKDCAVIGAPDDKWGEAVTAVIELKAGTEVSAEQIIELCRSRLGPIKAPKQVHFWPALPRSAVGKVLKRQIREQFWVGRQRRI
jgi:fatty-acyl-CoA synthase